MIEQDNEILEAKKKYFDSLNAKNSIDHTRIDELDLENIGIVLNYQQVDLMKLALSSNKVSYKDYQNNLIKKSDVLTSKGKRERYILILKCLSEDKELPDKTKEVIAKMYEQTKSNQTISAETIADVLNKLIFKLSTVVQDLIFNKIHKYGIVEKEGIKDMSMEEASKLLTYVEKDYTSITIKEEASFNDYVNPNGSYFKDNLKTMLDFAYELDKEVRIGSLLPKKIPDYLKNLSKDMLKQKVLSYVDEVTKYFNVYNSTHKRVDRKPIIRSIDVYDELENSEWMSIFSLNDMCDIIAVARKNLPDILFCYNEVGLEDEGKRKRAIANITEIMKYGSKHRKKLVDLIGTKMSVDLDVTKEQIIEELQAFGKLDLNIAVTEFNVAPTEFMLLNNSRKEIEILRDRFISDFCNIITNLCLSKMILLDSITIDCVCDNQSHVLTSVNEERIRNRKPIFRTLYNGMYDDNMHRKEDRFRDKVTNKKGDKGFADTLYVGTIVLGLLIVIAIVIVVFLRYVN